MSRIGTDSMLKPTASDDMGMALTNQTLPTHCGFVESNETETGYARNGSVSCRVDYIISLTNSVIQPVICSFGILGNLLIIAVFSRLRVHQTGVNQEKTIHIGFLAMAVSDLLFCICVLPRTFINEHDLVLKAGSFAMFYQLYSTGFITMFCLTGTWLILITAGIRYVGICHPLRARYLVSSSGTCVAIFLVTVTCVFANLPSFWIVRAELLRPGYYIMDLGIFNHFHTGGKVYLCLRGVFGMFIPGILLLYFNINLLLVMRSSKRLHESFTRHSIHNTSTRESRAGGVRIASKNHLTRLLVAIVIMFIVLVYPCELLDFIAILHPVHSHKRQAFIIARVVANLLQVCNFAFNFLLYCIMNGTFRKGLAQLFCIRQPLPEGAAYIPPAPSRRRSKLTSHLPALEE